MPKVILKSNYIKGGGKHGANLVSYIGTRDGVEKHVQKYVDYIANREGVEKISEHGLFTSGNDKIILSQVQNEVANHNGNIWLPIISLTREDAMKTGFDNGTAWKNMLSQIAPKIAEFYKIKIDNLQWYASFHNESHHPHVHMIVYSKDQNEGYLTQKGIEKFKSTVTKEVFSLELEQVYALQSMQRDEVKQKCQEIFEDVKVQLNNDMLSTIIDLNYALKNQKGKKSYGYLKKNDKKIVDKIVNELEKMPEIKAIYDLWYETRFEIYGNYTDEKPEKIPLSQQKEFRSIKNMIIDEVDNLKLDLTVNLTENTVQEQPKQPNIVQTANAILNVLASVEKLFEQQITKDCTTMNQRIDKKSLEKIARLKESKGQKHTGEDLQNTYQMTSY